jgi:heme exporter protein A
MEESASSSLRRGLDAVSGGAMKLVADNLTCERGGRIVFSGLSFSLEAGQLLLLKGPNGSGKTSLLRLIAGFAEPVGGSLMMQDGHGDLTIGQRCHLVQHQDAVKSALTVEENLAFWSGFLGGGDVEAALSAFALERLSTTSAAYLSAGQRRRLALSRLALVPRPLWLLDEPSVGLDAASLERLKSLISGQVDKGGMVIASTHVDIGVAAAAEIDLAQIREAAA